MPAGLGDLPQHFAYAILGPHQDQALLRPGIPLDEHDLDRYVDETAACRPCNFAGIADSSVIGR